MERVFLVGVEIKGARYSDVEGDSDFDELRQLLKTAGGVCAGEKIFAIERPDAAFHIGSGQAKELALLCHDARADAAVFGINLKSVQQRNLENLTKVKIIDRTRLILDIFALSAHTQDGKNQVELARCEYTLSRLAGMWTHLERQQGGIGSRGPGESEIETDRRILEKRISLLKKKLKSLEQRRNIQRTRRLKSGIPVVAICGYTNSGKTTLLNALTKSNAAARDALFQTLQPMTRRTKIFEKDVLFVDTVGFIRNIPTRLINAFHSTLEEIAPASVILIVLDSSDRNVQAQKEVVEKTLVELKYDNIPKIYVANKCDKTDKKFDFDDVPISALYKIGLENLKNRIDRML